MIDMKVVHKQTEAERKRGYRERMGPALQEREAARMRKSREDAIPEFIGVDGEGAGQGPNQRYVLLSVGDQSFTNPNGITWSEAFRFLYEQFYKHPKAAFVGFYLGYDFDKIISFEAGLPQKVARMLLSPSGKALRKKPENRGQRSSYYPVRHEGWEFDMLGKKRLSIRPIAHGCKCGQKMIKCPLTKHNAWMSLCDAGAFFQMSFLTVLQKFLAQDETLCTQEEYNRIEKGKARRDHAKLDAEMIAYNILENELLARVMVRLAKGYLAVGIKLARDQWYGPGAAAAKWLAKNGVIKREQLVKDTKKGKRLIPGWFWAAARKSYFGGWFEIFIHGIVRGISYNYDINNAYPYAATKLPHICRECEYRRGNGDYDSDGEYVLLYATVFTNGNRIGAMPYRDRHGSILRPSISKGWYWRHEIDAARRAGLVKKVMVNEWMEFVPCNHPWPLVGIQGLYDLRISVGKDSAQGWAIKLTNNSIYGKFAQAVGSMPYNNWLYASYITSHCRTQILDAIATHPRKADAVLMVATDGICFDSVHPYLPKSKDLGDWGESTYTDLCLFKPGVYWHKEGKEKLLKVKSRGVPKTEFLAAIEWVESWYNDMEKGALCPEDTLEEYDLVDGKDSPLLGTVLRWPRFQVPIKFRIKSGKQALNEGHWEDSGLVQNSIMVVQDSDPQSKRRKPYRLRGKSYINTVIHELPIKELETHYHKEVKVDHGPDLGTGYDGSARSGIIEALTIARDKPANYDLPAGEEWVRVWG